MPSTHRPRLVVRAGTGLYQRGHCGAAFAGAAAPRPLNCAYAVLASKLLSPRTKCSRFINDPLQSTPDTGQQKLHRILGTGAPGGTAADDGKCCAVQVARALHAILSRCGCGVTRAPRKVHRDFYRAITALCRWPKGIHCHSEVCVCGGLAHDCLTVASLKSMTKPCWLGSGMPGGRLHPDTCSC